MEVRAILPGEPYYDWQGNLKNLSAVHAEGVGAYENGQLIGTLTWRILADAIHLAAAFVLPEYRSQGIFQRLFSYVTALHPDLPVVGESHEGNPVKNTYDTYNYHLLRGTAKLTGWQESDILIIDKGEGYGKEVGQGQGSESSQEAFWRESQAQRYVIAGNEGEEYAWPSFDDIHEISLAAVDNHQGYRDTGLLEGAVGNTRIMQQYGQHEDIFDTAANLIAKVQRQQAIVEGNKRTATNVGLAFLANNGYDISPVVDSEQKEDQLVNLIMEVSASDEAISDLAEFLRQNSRLEKTAAWSPEDAFNEGTGAAFWYDPATDQLHWGETHHNIFHDLYSLPGEYENMYHERDKEIGLFGWIFPTGHNSYSIDFGSDFGFGANKENAHLRERVAEEVAQDIGYPPDNYYYSHTAGHAFESDDLLNDRADALTTPGAEIHCQNCGSMVNDPICGDCGTENLMWWTGNGEGLQNFKGSLQKKSITVEGSSYSCFAFIPPLLFLGNRHHMAIMNQLLQHGWTWEQLMGAQQLWGWAADTDDEEDISLYLQTDAAMIDKSLLPQLEAAFTKLTGKSEFILKSDQEPTNEEYAPDWDYHYGEGGIYTDVPGVLVYNTQTEQLEYWNATDAHTGSWQEDLQFTRFAALDRLWSVGYNSKTSDAWNEAFEEPIVDEDLGDFEQETNSLTEQEKQAQGIEGPFNIDGWTVWTRDCDNQYPTHDAIWMDRANKIMAIGWQGGHSHLFDSPFLFNLTANGSSYEQTTGHFRQAPSTTEPFPAGWGWHGSPATKEERNILKQVIKDHYGVNKLKDLYKSNDDAEENYFDVGNDDEIDPHAAAVKAIQNLTKQQIYDIIKVNKINQGV